MSINLKIRFEIHNIQDIHAREDKTQREAIYAAAKQYLTEEGLLDSEMVVDFLGKDGFLCAYTMSPISVSGVGTWIPRVMKEWEEMAYGILGDSCKPGVEVEYTDKDDY